MQSVKLIEKLLTDHAINNVILLVDSANDMYINFAESTNKITLFIKSY